MINFQSYVKLPEGSRRTISDYKSWILDIIGYACLFVLKQMSGESQEKKRGKFHLGFLARDIHLEHYFPNVQTIF